MVRADSSGRPFYINSLALRDRGRIERQRRVDLPFARDLEAWLDTTLRLYGDRILPLTVNIARRWGRLSVQIGNKNLDGAIAATALEHGLTVVTRNVAHHELTGVAIVNPFEAKARRLSVLGSKNTLPCPPLLS